MTFFLKLCRCVCRCSVVFKTASNNFSVLFIQKVVLLCKPFSSSNTKPNFDTYQYKTKVVGSYFYFQLYISNFLIFYILPLIYPMEYYVIKMYSPSVNVFIISNQKLTATTC